MLTQYCYLLAMYESVFRAPVHSPVLDLSPSAPLSEQLALVPEAAVVDLVNLTKRRPRRSALFSAARPSPTRDLREVQMSAEPTRTSSPTPARGGEYRRGGTRTAPGP